MHRANLVSAEVERARSLVRVRDRSRAIEREQPHRPRLPIRPRAPSRSPTRTCTARRLLAERTGLRGEAVEGGRVGGEHNRRVPCAHETGPCAAYAGGGVGGGDCSADARGTAQPAGERSGVGEVADWALTRVAPELLEGHEFETPVIEGGAHAVAVAESCIESGRTVVCYIREAARRVSSHRTHVQPHPHRCSAQLRVNRRDERGERGRGSGDGEARAAEHTGLGAEHG
mmetsp:Transcript_4835/g.12392  ORF Transcript_4835/g.12392 Transcript_4835/m.12392 type:complete len:230 (+) Transcript_4835:325-1014(+)